MKREEEQEEEREGKNEKVKKNRFGNRVSFANSLGSRQIARLKIWLHKTQTKKMIKEKFGNEKRGKARVAQIIEQGDLSH